MSDNDEIVSSCLTCHAGIHWIAAPTGGWWKHLVHPEDDHDATTDVEVEEEVTGDGLWVTRGVKRESGVSIYISAMDTADARALFEHSMMLAQSGCRFSGELVRPVDSDGVAQLYTHMKRGFRA